MRKRLMKKFLSVILAFVMIISVFSLSATAVANETSADEIENTSNYSLSNSYSEYINGYVSASKTDKALKHLLKKTLPIHRLALTLKYKTAVSIQSV